MSHSNRWHERLEGQPVNGKLQRLFKRARIIRPWAFDLHNSSGSSSPQHQGRTQPPKELLMENKPGNTGTSPGAQKFDTAINFLDNLKATFRETPQVYSQFLGIMKVRVYGMI